MEKAGQREFQKYIKKNYIFLGNSKPNCIPLCPKIEKKMQIQGQIK